MRDAMAAVDVVGHVDSAGVLVSRFQDVQDVQDSHVDSAGVLIVDKANVGFKDHPRDASSSRDNIAISVKTKINLSAPALIMEVKQCSEAYPQSPVNSRC